MFVNISPAEYNQDETLTTLVYGTRAKMITNDTQKNIESRQSSKMGVAYKNMQLQLDCAIQTLKSNKIQIPPEIKLEDQSVSRENESAGKKLEQLSKENVSDSQLSIDAVNQSSINLNP